MMNSEVTIVTGKLYWFNITINKVYITYIVNDNHNTILGTEYGLQEHLLYTHNHFATYGLLSGLSWCQ